MNKSKADVKAKLYLKELPDDGFMKLLKEAGDGDIVEGPYLDETSRAYTPDEIEETMVGGVVGSLLAQARSESGRSLAAIGADTGVTRARIQQIERSENIEVATLVRFAAACGYQVRISLRPLAPDKRAFSAVLHGAGG